MWQALSVKKFTWIFNLGLLAAILLKWQHAGIRGTLRGNADNGSFHQYASTLGLVEMFYHQTLMTHISNYYEANNWCILFCPALSWAERESERASCSVKRSSATGLSWLGQFSLRTKHYKYIHYTYCTNSSLHNTQTQRDWLSELP